MLDKNIKLTCNMILVDRDKENDFFSLMSVLFQMKIRAP